MVKAFPTQSSFYYYKIIKWVWNYWSTKCFFNPALFKEERLWAGLTAPQHFLQTKHNFKHNQKRNRWCRSLLFAESDFIAAYWWAEPQVDWIASILDQTETDETGQTKGSSCGTLEVLEVNSLIWCGFLWGWTNSQPPWRLAVDIKRCSPPSSEQRQYILKRRETGAGNLAPSGETWCLIGEEPDLIVSFQLSHNQLTFSQYLIKATFD